VEPAPARVDAVIREACAAPGGGGFHTR
jgi:hypothetical protein